MKRRAVSQLRVQYSGQATHAWGEGHLFGSGRYLMASEPWFHEPRSPMVLGPLLWRS